MEFYDRVVELCKNRGTSPAALARAIGLSNSVTTYWKRGAVPKGDTLQKVADYFGVSVDYLLGKAYTQDGVSFSDGTGFGGGSGSGVGFDNGSGYGGPIPRLPDEAEADDFVENLKKLSVAARSALEPPKITETKEQLLSILEELSDEDLETLVKFAQFVKYQQQEKQEAAEAPPAPAGDTDTPAAQGAPERRQEGE